MISILNDEELNFKNAFLVVLEVIMGANFLIFIERVIFIIIRELPVYLFSQIELEPYCILIHRIILILENIT